MWVYSDWTFCKMCLITKCKQKVSSFFWSAPSGPGIICTSSQFGWEWVLAVCPKWEPQLRSGHRKACDGWTELSLIAFLVLKLLNLGFVVLWGGFRNGFWVEFSGARGALKQHVTFLMWSGSWSAAAASPAPPNWPSKSLQNLLQFFKVSVSGVQRSSWLYRSDQSGQICFASPVEGLGSFRCHLC